MRFDSKIFVAGHRGLVGSATVRRLMAERYENILVRSRDQLDLRDPAAVASFFEETKPEYVFLAAARVGGILANSTRPADFIYDNLAIEISVIHAAWKAGVKKLAFLGSSCIYPKRAHQPIAETELLTGPLELTNEWYAVAKIAGIKMCQAYRRQYGFNAISLMPTNLYGPGDNFDLETSHVVPALIRKFSEAKISAAREVILWGTGSPRREFLHVDDLAAAAIFLMRQYDSGEIVNVGTGEDVTIRELAETIAQIVGYDVRIRWDDSKPDGTSRKLLDVTRIKSLGWKPSIALREGLESTYRWYEKTLASAMRQAVQPAGANLAANS